MATYLSPVERPRGLLKKFTYRVMRRMFGLVPTGTKVFTARMPTAFMAYYAKAYRLDKKLQVPTDTAYLVRHKVASINMCTACMDIGRYYGLKKSPETLTRLDAVSEYGTSPLFTGAERAALDYARELTTTKAVAPGTFARLSEHYGEREICEIAYLVASEHMANMTNLGLGVGSDNLCEISQQRRLQKVSSS
jgi:alkylhydroperoxidase family enzyme